MPKSVALLIESSNAYARGLLQGIASYIHQHELWSIYLPEQERGSPPPSWLTRWKGDGVIARIENEAIAEVIHKLSIPVVDVSAARLLPNIPGVETNDQVIGRMAFEHLRERGFERFAYCGDPQFQWSQLRGEAFQNNVHEAGFSCQTYQFSLTNPTGLSIKGERGRLSKWIFSLPRPVAMLACYDYRAQLILDVCRELNVKVPSEVAVMGVDNDEMLCDLCTPPLSSVIPDARATGQAAAAMLDRLMSGLAVESLFNLVDPLGVATRQSTDVLAIDDPEISTAVRFIRDHCCDGINVQDVVNKVSITRRVLESRFQKIVGRTPHQEISRRRIERVRRLLLTTDLTLAEIARRTGYQNKEYLNVAFRRGIGVPPATYRRDQRKRNDGSGLET